MRFSAKLHPSLHKVSHFINADSALEDDAVQSNPGLPNVLLLTLVNDEKSWGGNRTFRDYLGMTHTFLFPRHHTSIGFLVSSLDEYNAMKATLKDTLSTTVPIPSPYGLYTGITLIYKPPFDNQIDRSQRHLNHAQKERRRLIARLRNYLLYSVLKEEHDWVLWMDADIVKVPPEAIGVIVDSGKDIVTLRCVSGSNGDYDQNAWRGPRVPPTPEQLQDLRKGGLYVPVRGEGSKGFWELMSSDPDERFRMEPLDSVGGTFLAVQAEIFRQGVAFPTLYVVGTEWDMVDGWDGIETEGLCFLARSIGRKCWGMPNLYVNHYAE
ncbi:hypothetical protein HK097_011583 [Rhizophlyctis rosea]|uniref:Uncharacterized protein n=1 Tax=Rhizophlyctis rosea TaxID=64517 RepID=A0AAD5S988_9FUNG|nr:hypothetical protein HK097_011583 [Rhizophlyctis rosea]